MDERIYKLIVEVKDAQNVISNSLEEIERFIVEEETDFEKQMHLDDMRECQKDFNW